MSELQQAIAELLIDFSGTWQLPYVVSTREDGNLDVATENGNQSWVLSLLISEA